MAARPDQYSFCIALPQGSSISLISGALAQTWARCCNDDLEPSRICLNWLRAAPFGQLCVAILERCLSIALLLYSRAGPLPHSVVDLPKIRFALAQSAKLGWAFLR